MSSKQNQSTPLISPFRLSPVICLYLMTLNETFSRSWKMADEVNSKTARSTLQQLMKIHYQWAQTIAVQQTLQFQLGSLIGQLSSAGSDSPAASSPGALPSAEAPHAASTAEQPRKAAKRGRVVNASRSLARAAGTMPVAVPPALKAPRPTPAAQLASQPAVAASPRGMLQLMQARRAATEMTMAAAMRTMGVDGPPQPPPLDAAASIASGQATASRASSTSSEGVSSPDTIGGAPFNSQGERIHNTGPALVAAAASWGHGASGTQRTPQVHASTQAVRVVPVPALAASTCVPAPQPASLSALQATLASVQGGRRHMAPPVAPLSDSDSSADDSGSEMGGELHEDGIPDAEFIRLLKRAELVDMATVSHVPMPTKKAKYRLVRRNPDQDSSQRWKITLPNCPERNTWQPVLEEAASYHGDFMAALLREWCLVQMLEVNPVTVDMSSLAERMSVWPRTALENALATSSTQPQRHVAFNFPSMHQFWVALREEEPFGSPTWIGPNMLVLARMAQRARIHVRSPGTFRLLLALAYEIDCAQGTRHAGEDVHRILALRPPPHTFDEVQAYDVIEHVYTMCVVRPSCCAKANVMLALRRRALRKQAGAPLPPLTSAQLAEAWENTKNVKPRTMEHPTLFGVQALVARVSSQGFGCFTVKAPRTLRNPSAKGLARTLRHKTDFMAALVREYCSFPKRSNFIKSDWVLHRQGQQVWEGPAVQFLARYEKAHPDNVVTMDNYAAISDMAHQGHLLPPRLPGPVPAILPPWAGTVLPLPPPRHIPALAGRQRQGDSPLSPPAASGRQNSPPPAASPQLARGSSGAAWGLASAPAAQAGSGRPWTPGA